MSQRTHQRPRVLLADDDVAICDAASRLLASSCDVIGRALDSASLFDAIEQLRPDLVVLDFSLPGSLGGLEVCRRIKKNAPEVGVIAFTGNDDEQLKRLAHEAGASAFVWKLDAATDLLPTIVSVFERISRSSAR